MRKIILLFLFFCGLAGAQTGSVTLLPQYMDLSSTTSQGAVLFTVGGYSGSDTHYRLYSGSGYFYIWAPSTNQYITASAYTSNPPIPGDPTTSTSWWAMFQRGSINTQALLSAVNFRSRIGTSSSNYQTFAVGAITQMTAGFNLTGTVSAGGSYDLTQKYVVLGFDAETGGSLLCTSSTDITTGSYTLACQSGSTIKRVEFRTIQNAIATSVTNASGWTSTTALGDMPLPVELTSFTANVSGKNVRLNWQTATEKNNFGFEIERSLDKINFKKIGFIQGSGTSNSVKEYSYMDNLNASAKVYYRLKQIDNDGTYSYSNIAEAAAAPDGYALEQNYPNPFNPTTNISFSLPEASFVKLVVYNAIGEEVEQLENGTLEKGIHTYSFNGKSFNSGVYFYKLTANNYTSVKKMILIK